MLLGLGALEASWCLPRWRAARRALRLARHDHAELPPEVLRPGGLMARHWDPGAALIVERQPPQETWLGAWLSAALGLGALAGALAGRLDIAAALGALALLTASLTALLRRLGGQRLELARDEPIRWREQGRWRAAPWARLRGATVARRDQAEVVTLTLTLWLAPPPGAPADEQGARGIEVLTHELPTSQAARAHTQRLFLERALRQISARSAPRARSTQEPSMRGPERTHGAGSTSAQTDATRTSSTRAPYLGALPLDEPSSSQEALQEYP